MHKSLGMRLIGTKGAKLHHMPYICCRSPPLLSLSPLARCAAQTRPVHRAVPWQEFTPRVRCAGAWHQRRRVRPPLPVSPAAPPATRAGELRRALPLPGELSLHGLCPEEEGYFNLYLAI